MPRVGFVSLGCPKALVDSERILTQLRGEGYQVADRYDGADLVIVNTCGFIDAAREESLEAIGEALAENGRVIVTGCLGVHEQLIRDAHPRVLAVTGPHDYEAVMAQVHAHLPPVAAHAGEARVPVEGVRLTPRHYAYLKVSEGCNHKCSFCIIPQMRGRLASRPLPEVLEEAERLVATGVRELLVISQDTSAYGVDRRFEPVFHNGRPLQTRFQDLVAALSELGVWVRLHYVYPYPHVDQVIPQMGIGGLLPYLDVPLQHGSPRILKAMRRPAATENTLERIQRWRDTCPELTLRSTFITGFPGETDEDFEMLLEFLEAAQLDRVGCFTYSAVAGAAANALPDHVPAELAAERQEILMHAQQAISAARLRGKIGSEIEVLVDEVEPDRAIARGPGDAPEIDGQVFVETFEDLKPGDRVRVRVSGSSEHDLFAETI